jgi:uncharacterized surface protein with fasciclin (FAS1) repeats
MTFKTLQIGKTLVAGALMAFASAVAVADSTGQAGSDILSVAKQSGQFNTLTKALEASGLSAELAAQGPMTILAPTDEAFAKLPAADLEALMKPENKDQLKKILAYHVVPGKALAADDLKKRRSAPTAAGQDVKVALVNGRVRVDQARVQGDIDASNGVILPIDRVLLPQ